MKIKFIRQIRLAFRLWVKEKIYMLFYSLLVEVLEDEMDFVIFLRVNGENYFETKMKHIPQTGNVIRFGRAYREPEEQFLVNRVTLLQFGSVAYLDGVII